MPRLTNYNLGFAIAGALLLLAGGCQAPWSADWDSSRLETEHRRASEQPSAADAIKAATAAADDATVATVMQEARQISASDPAAGKLLLDELSRSEPKLWPLVVEQFRSRQAYSQQLSAQPAVPPRASADVADVAATDPPSAEVGRLTDPRGVRPDPVIEQAFATATPANMPAPGMRPGDKETGRQGTTDSHVVPASFPETPGGVEHALFNVVAEPPKEIRSMPADESADQATHDWQEHLDLAIEDLSNRVSDGPRSTAEVHQLASLRLLELLAGRTEDALRPIPKISAQEQDYWSSQIFALATFLDHHRQPDDKRRAAASVTHLDEAVGHLRELGTLSLRNLAFCKNVYGYGAYEPLNHPNFTAGQQVSLYLEVENYHSESTEKGYSTLLGASYEVVDEAGDRVAGGEFPNVEDCCQSRRRDFHIQYGLLLPKSIKPGKYRLQLAMKDRQSDKIGHASIGFDVR